MKKKMRMKMMKKRKLEIFKSRRENGEREGRRRRGEGKCMMDRHLILHLTLINDIGPGIIQRIVQKRSEFNSSDLYLFSPSDWMHKFGFTELTAEKFSDGLQNKRILEYELGLIERNNIQWTTVDDETYPALLREIYLPPAVLYCRVCLPNVLRR